MSKNEEGDLKKTLTGMMVAGALTVAATTVSAAPIGNINLANTGGGGVRVTATTIDWTPLGPGGDMVTGFGTNLTYDFGVLGAGVSGTILDLPPVPVNNFMTFAGHPSLAFNLAGIGPGSANLNCATVTAAGQSCSVFAGSPFVLTYLSPVSTTVSLAAFGLATDATGASNWTGSFSTQVNMSAEQIQNFFLSNPNAFIDSTYSGSFIADFTPVPEPMSLGLLGLVLGAGAALRRRRAQ